MRFSDLGAEGRHGVRRVGGYAVRVLAPGRTPSPMPALAEE